MDKDLYLQKENSDKTDEKSEFDEELFGKLREKRLEIARKEHVSAFVIFNDTTLRDIVAKKPVKLEEFLDIKGIGSYKLDKYGDEFIEEVRKFLKEHRLSDVTEEILRKSEKKTNRQGEKWTDTEDKWLEEEYYSGMSIAEIARAHKRTIRAIRLRIRKIGLIEKGMPKIDKSIKARKKDDDFPEYGFLTKREKLLYVKGSRHYAVWSGKEKEEVKEEFLNGKPLDEIALHHGRTIRIIVRKLIRFGVWGTSNNPVYKGLAKKEIGTLFIRGNTVDKNEKNIMLSEFYAGKNIEEIALKHGVTVKYLIRTFAEMAVMPREYYKGNKEQKEGTKQRIISEYKKGKSIEKIAEMFGMPKETVRNKLGRWGYLFYSYYGDDE